MRKILIVALRDYNATVRTKTFLISLFFLPLMLGGSFLVQFLLKDIGGKPHRYAIVDRTPGGWLYPKLERAVEVRNANRKEGEPLFLLERVAPETDIPQQRLDLSERVRQKELRGFLDIGPDIDQSGKGKESVRLYTSSSLAREFPQWASAAINAAVQEKRSERAKISFKELQKLQEPVVPAPRDLAKRDPKTGEIDDNRQTNQVASFLMPFGLVMLMFMMIFIGATPLMQGVIEEKSARIAEVLLGSVQPFQLMMGKLLACLGVATTLSAIYLGGAYWAAYHYGYTQYLPTDVLIWFLIFQSLGVLMYGSVFIAVGAACTNAQETQTFLMPVMLLAMLPMFVLQQVIREPDGALATGVSFFPPSTPMLMVLRVAIPPGVPWWQPVLGVVLVLATTVGCVYVAGRIFRVGILMQGKGAQFSDLVRWVVRG